MASVPTTVVTGPVAAGEQRTVVRPHGEPPGRPLSPDEGGSPDQPLSPEPPQTAGAKHPLPSRPRRNRSRLVPYVAVLALVVLAVGAMTLGGRSASSKFSSVGNAIDSGSGRPAVPAGDAQPVARASGGQSQQASSSASPAGAAPASSASAAPSSAGVKVLDAPASETGRKVVSTGSLTVRTDDVVSAKSKADEVAVNLGGLVFGEQTTVSSTSKSQVTLKVPPEAFEQALRELAGLGRLVSEEVKTDDVTQQVVDLDARIHSAEASLARVRDLVGRTNNLTELASLENEVQRRQADLESLQGQKRTLEGRTDQATIVLTLETAAVPPGSREASAAPPEPSHLPGFADGINVGWNALVSTGTVVGAALGLVLPFVWLAAPIAAVWMLGRRRHSRRLADAPA